MLKKSILTTLITFIILSLICCKNNAENNDSNVIKEVSNKKLDSIKPEITETSTSKVSSQDSFSFTISCGSGCAMIYNEQSRITNDSSYEIKFNVETFIDEVLSEEMVEIYVFERDKNGKIINVHLKGSQKNLLLDDNAILKPYLFKVSETLSLGKNGNQIDSKKLFEANEPYNPIKLPFDSKEFIQKKSIIGNEKYEPSRFLIDYLIKKDYEGEEYNCFFLKSENGITNIIVSILRGDSQYFVLIKSNQESILSFEEIGNIGGEDTLYFKIDRNFIITTYDLDSVEIKKLKI